MPASGHLTRLILGLSLGALAAIGTSRADTAVNTYTTGNQARPSIAADGQGRFIVVWASEGQDGDGQGIFGRRFGVDGQPVGGEFPVNSLTTGNQTVPRVAANASGSFLVVWQGPGGNSRDVVLGQRFDSTGQPINNEFQINEDTTLDQRTPAAALADDGSFLVAWSNQERLAARHFDSAAAPTTGDFELAVDDAYYPYGFRSFQRRDVEALPDGNFVVVWHDHFYTGYNYQYSDTIQGAIFDDLANPVATLNVAAGAPAEQQRGPALAPTDDGGFVVVWGGYSNYAAYSRIFGRSFDSAGAPLSPTFDATPTGETFIRPVDVAAVGDDQFLVIWNAPEIEARYVATDGTLLGEPFVLNRDQTPTDTGPVIASAAGDLMVAWTRDDGGPAMDEIAAVGRFWIFADGFESGATTNWTSTLSP